MDIVIFGFAGSGKDTVSSIIAEEGFKQLAFGDSIKDMLSVVFCWPRDLLEGVTDESRIWRETVDEWWSARLGIPNFTPRYAMTNIGTDIFRYHIKDEIWVLNMERRIMGDPSKKIIKDGRFKIEADFARRNDMKLVRVKRGDEPKWYKTALEANNGCETSEKKMKEIYKIHISERDWIGLDFDIVVENNGSINDLREKVKTILL